MSAGIHEDFIVFKTSDPINPIFTVKVRIKIKTYGNSTSMVPIEGNVIDAGFDKKTNILFHITQNPAELTSYNIVSKIKKNYWTEIPIVFHYRKREDKVYFRRIGKD